MHVFRAIFVTWILISKHFQELPSGAEAETSPPREDAHILPPPPNKSQSASTSGEKVFIFFLQTFKRELLFSYLHF